MMNNNYIEVSAFRRLHMHIDNYDPTHDVESGLN